MTKRKTLITCTRRFQFCAGHRVMGHENKCAHLHGHNYVAYVTCAIPALDGIGRVVDFSEIKHAVGTWIDCNWDHGFILNAKDHATYALLHNYEPDGKQIQKLFLMPCNPTAENMARYLLNSVCPVVFLAMNGVMAIEVVIEETENCKATARLEME
jgi:6-pyruvoyltetrahydropterin/6-carboxytetrahydropterin synthase